MTISSPDGSFSISTSRNSTPRSFKNVFARRQSGHHMVLYIVIGSINCLRVLDVAGEVRSQSKYIPNANALRSLHDCRASPRCVLTDLEADESSLQRGAGASPIDLGITRGDACACALQRQSGALAVNFFGELRCFRQYSYAIRQNFRESANNSEMHFIFAASTSVSQFPDTELGNQRRMSR